ncbi:MAG TPA: RNA methyltransferase [Caldithrix abyssi]|uniref:tRNA (cytidine/uridine-2'-O-)-methyltransferase TrmJ n=1 Tax=Caldithrix abyssi TaxID=187145 RepID=A0A7V1LYT4_CALAY|nr:RNA methyltransferase [Caldithrix abyssi]
MLLENICIVLVQPESPGNIGSVARAMKTSGLNDLRLVNPCETDHADMRRMAHRSREIVLEAGRFTGLEEAVADCHLVVGTTMRRRHNPFPLITPEQVAETVFGMADGLRAAIVFGSERNGLDNADLSRCGVHSTIPIATQNPALNLAQAAMIYCNTLYRRSEEKHPAQKELEPATQAELEHLYLHLRQAIEKTSFIPRDDMDTFLSRFRRLIGRARPEQRDVQLLHKIVQILSEEKYNRGKNEDAG